MFFKHFLKPSFLCSLRINAIVFVYFSVFIIIMFCKICSGMSLTSLFWLYYKELFCSHMKFLNHFFHPVKLSLSSHTFIFLSSGVRSVPWPNTDWEAAGFRGAVWKGGKRNTYIISASVSTCTTNSCFPK